MPTIRTFVAAAAVALLACLAAGCAAGAPTGGTLGMWGRTLVDEETGAFEGVGIVRLQERSPLREQDVRPGDVIVSVEGHPPGSTADMERRIFKAGWENSLRMEVRRGDVVREIDVLPAPTFRQFRLGIGLPWLVGTRQDAVEILPLSLFRIGVGPDYKGFMILNCLGFESGPESNDFWLVVLHTGTQYGPVVDRPKKKPDLLTIPE